MTESVGLFLKYEFCCQESTNVFTRQTRRPFPVLIILPHDPSVRIYCGKSTPSVAVFCCFCLFFPPLSWEECLIGPQRNATFSNPPNTRGECLPQRRETSVLWTRGNPAVQRYPPNKGSLKITMSVMRHTFLLLAPPVSQELPTTVAVKLSLHRSKKRAFDLRFRWLFLLREISTQYSYLWQGRKEWKNRERKKKTLRKKA